MKFVVALALAVGSSFEQQTTRNECWLNEGAERIGECFDLFFSYCDEYKLEPEETCNIFTFSRSAVKYLTYQI